MKYAHRFNHHHHNKIPIFWLPANNVHGFSEAYAQIAQSCLIPDRNKPNANILNLVRSWLIHYKKWLIVVDGISDLFPIEDYVPNVPHGSVLITTRDEGFVRSKAMINYRVLAVGKMTQVESMELVRLRTPGIEICTADEVSELSIIAGRVPSRIIAAAAQIQDQHLALTKYLTMRRQAATDALQSLSFAEMNRRYDVIYRQTGDQGATTWGWLFETSEYQEWVKDHGLLWIKGRAGCGKSTLLKSAILTSRIGDRSPLAVKPTPDLGKTELPPTQQDFQQSEPSQKTLLLSFFFDTKGTNMMKSRSGLFRTLLHQLLSQCSELLYFFTIQLQNECDLEGVPMVHWSWPDKDHWDLEIYFKHYMLSALDSLSVTVYVDAIDECESDSREGLVEYFRDLCLESLSKPYRLGVCFSSRHSPPLAQIPVILMGLMEEKQNDIQANTRNELEEMSIFGDGRQPKSLIEAARKCQTHLETLGEYAQKSKAEHHTSATKTLMDEVFRHTSGSIESLKLWTIEIEKGRQTSDESIINTVSAYFEELEERITSAEAALEHRHRLGWLQFEKFVPESKYCHHHLADSMQGKKQTRGSCKLKLLSAPQ